MVIIGIVLTKLFRSEKFGSGKFRTKIFVIVTATLLLTFRAVWGTVSTWLPPVERSQPLMWWYKKPVFYTVQLLTELLVVYLYALVRVDRRFFTPTGQKGSYATLPSANTVGHPPLYSIYDFPTQPLCAPIVRKSCLTIRYHWQIPCTTPIHRSCSTMQAANGNFNDTI